MNINFNIDQKSLTEYFLSSDNRNASFTRSIKLLWEVVRLKKTKYPTFILDSKLSGYSFANILNVKTPIIYQANVAADEIIFRENTVVKPMFEDSAKGVLLIQENEVIRCLYSGRIFKGFDQAKQYCKNLLGVKRVKIDKWLVEEMIKGTDIAQDIKFYSFYGQVGLILESQRIPNLKRCWYDENLNLVSTGRYDEDLFIGKSQVILKPLIEIAKAISLEIPAPFVRIDFLKQDDNVYLGEFTPIPGGYQNFNLEWDIKLGELYQKASTRLVLDISSGKEFKKYKKFQAELS